MKAYLATRSCAAYVQNQLASVAMKLRQTTIDGVQAIQEEAAVARESFNAVFAVISVVLAVGILAFVSSHSAQPLQLTLLALLALCGLFFLLAFATGRLRIASPTGDGAASGTFADHLPEAILLTTRTGALSYRNLAFDALFDIPSSPGIEALEARFTGRPDAAAALFRLVRAGERGETLAEEVQLDPAEGQGGASRILHVGVQPFESQHQGGRPLVLWTFVDVTLERARAAKQAAALNQRIAVYETAELGLFCLTGHGTVTQINATLRGWLGLAGGEREAAVDETWPLAAVLSPTGAQLLQSFMARYPNAPIELDLDVPTPSGRPVSIHISGPARAKPSQTRLPATPVVLLVTQRVAAGLTRSEPEGGDAGFARLFQSAPFGIATITASGRIAGANTAFARMVLDPTGGIDDHAVDVLCRDTKTEQRARVAAALDEVVVRRGHSAPLDITTGPKGENGRRIYLSALAQGGRDAAILYVIDTTEQKALEVKFAQSQRMEAVGSLAGGIAHDFNNVLTAIIGSADLMLQTHRASDAAHKDIQNIKQSANRAAGLVRKLMAFSRQQTLQPDVLHLGEVMADLRPMLKTSLGDKVDLKISTDRDLWYVKADRIQMDQVVVNLAVNAQHAMAEGGSFTITTRNITERESQKLDYPGFTVGEYVMIEVADTGTGMSSDVMAKIFEPFFTTKDVGKGTGLGLATVYGIVKQSGGYIFPESTLGRGTTFRVYFPREHVENEAEMLAVKAAKKEQKPVDLTGDATVLIVEDEDMVRSIAVRSLSRLGYRVLEASTGVEALQVVADHPGQIDIVVSDVVMPEMDGPTFLKHVRRTNPDLRIIFVSGHTNEAFKTSLDEDENFAFLQKPFTLQQIGVKVKEELARPK
jgi:two-component system, cell cycle sensor histidine kinase and response regulator CckA